MQYLKVLVLVKCILTFSHAFSGVKQGYPAKRKSHISQKEKKNG